MHHYWLALGLLALLLSVLPRGAQAIGMDDGDFDVEVACLRGDTGMQMYLHLYTQLPHATLRFYDTADGFLARYDLNAALYVADDRGRRQGLVTTQSWRHEVLVPSFAATQEPQLSTYAHHQLPVAAGRYVVEVRIEDRATNQTMTRTIPVEVRSAAQPLMLSDLVLMDGYLERGRPVRSRVSPVVGLDQLRLKVYYEVYARSARAALARVEVVGPRKSGSLPLVGTLFGLRRGDEGDVVHTADEPFRAETGRVRRVTAIPLSDLEPGDYVVRVRLFGPNGQEADGVEKLIQVQEWSGLDDHILDLDAAIAQLAYVAKDNEIDHIRSASTEEEQRARFLAFWDRRDPTPGTLRNERMVEYYFRVDAANRRYGRMLGTLTSGWQTDRGYVLVRYGEPDYVERTEASDGEPPTEVWHYTRFGNRFIFVDRTGRGDFQLLTPIWDLQKRFR